MTKVESLIIKTHKAAAALTAVPDSRIKKTLRQLADELINHSKLLLAANRKDVARQQTDDPKTDRLRLTEERLANISASIKQISRHAAIVPVPAGYCAS